MSMILLANRSCLSGIYAARHDQEFYVKVPVGSSVLSSRASDTNDDLSFYPESSLIQMSGNDNDAENKNSQFWNLAKSSLEDDVSLKFLDQSDSDSDYLTSRIEAKQDADTIGEGTEDFFKENQPLISKRMHTHSFWGRAGRKYTLFIYINDNFQRLFFLNMPSKKL